ncbi:MAG TPA: ATP-binding cassette domain-containing protein [Chloroflexota bacterium]|nr:ATP-binding cassette domain-containing protein [Chloroflexota bacterium]
MERNAASEQRTPIMEARGISKHFGSVIALENADFEVYPGEIVALIGDNGAGKSTLIKILSGAMRPDTGTITFRGRPVDFHSPRDARAAGIETVYQDLALAPDLDVAANLFLGREIKQPGLLGRLDFYNQRAMRERAAEHLRELKVNLRSIRQTVDTLSGGQRQSVAVARAVFWGKDLIILDEPTAALGVAQSGMVLQLMRRIRDAGTAVIFISHNMPHVWEVADRMIVLRRGRRVGTLYPQEHTMDQAVSLMTGAITMEEAGAPA